MQTASNSQTLTIQLSPEDSERLLAEAKRRQLDAHSLAEILLHESLTELKPVADADIESLEKLYSFRGKTEILQFLEKHHFLMPVLLEAPDQIFNYFPGKKLCLEVEADSEFINSAQLFLDIIIDGDADEIIDEAIDKEEKLSEDWYLPLPYEVRRVFSCGVR
ncbi:hypothetical protein [Microcoleus vaginatus]|uniref:hypothetical protein n=1 Tax=Microcoleus vaginatus TaxID=119532 RepID=UPI001F6181F7|nr:hypothetical protein D0A37_21795 [Microcoleus vaginatus HSN003]